MRVFPAGTARYLDCVVSVGTFGFLDMDVIGAERVADLVVVGRDVDQRPRVAWQLVIRISLMTMLAVGSMVVASGVLIWL